MYPKSKHSLVLENGLRTNLEFSAPIYDCYYHWPNSLRKSNHKEEGITIHLFFFRHWIVGSRALYHERRGLRGGHYNSSAFISGRGGCHIEAQKSMWKVSWGS